MKGIMFAAVFVAVGCGDDEIRFDTHSSDTALCDGSCDVAPIPDSDASEDCTDSDCPDTGRTDTGSTEPPAGTACDDEDPCTVGDQWAGGFCAGTPMDCDSPPVARCDESSLLTASVVGTCVAGGCEYPTNPTYCPHGCDIDACLDDPCDGPQRCDLLGAIRCTEAGIQTCAETVAGCLGWGGSSACPSPAANGSAACDSEEACSVVCDEGFAACHGECTPEAARCGVPLSSDACETTSDCGPAGSCSDGDCICASGHLPCQAGCCPYVKETTELGGLSGQGIHMAIAPDGTLYMVVKRRTGSLSDVTYNLTLYSLAPGSDTPQTLAVIPDVTFRATLVTTDLEVRSDGRLFIAVATKAGAIKLYEWGEGMTAPLTTGLGSTESATPSVSITLDGASTLWATWGRKSGSDNVLVSRSLDGMTTFSGEIDDLMLNRAEADIEWNPFNGGIYAYGGDFYSGTYRRGVRAIGNSPPVVNGCRGTDAEFDANGVSWSVYTTSNPTRTYVCRAGQPTRYDRLKGIYTVTRALSHRFEIDGEGVAYIVSQTDNRVARWAATLDGRRGKSGTIVAFDPISAEVDAQAGIDQGVSVAVEIAPNGRPVFVALPRHPSMGPMTLVTF
jgi:hypothetical protein